MSGADDLALAREAQRGRTSALAEIVRRHQAAVRAFLIRLSGDPARADDLAQDTFLTAFGQLQSFRGEAAMRTWLCGIAYRKHLAELRSTARRREREASQATTDTTQAPRPEVTMDVREAFDALPFDLRAAAALCLASDMSHSEAAIVLAIPLGTLKSRIASAKKILAEALEAYR